MVAVWKTFGVKWNKALYITSYSFRITVTSVLYHLNVDPMRLRIYLGWSSKGTAWETYLRDYVPTPPLVDLFKHVSHPL
jgi:hypothetical protein